LQGYAELTDEEIAGLETAVCEAFAIKAKK